MTKPLLVLGYGNPSRGDDALGPLLLDFLENQADLSGVELLTDFQLQIEHALDLERRELVLFVDAAVNCTAGFEFAELSPARDNSYSSHAMNPAAVMSVYQAITGLIPPPCFLLSIQGLSFDLVAGLSDKAADNLQLSCLFAGELLDNPVARNWRQQIND